MRKRLESMTKPGVSKNESKRKEERARLIVCKGKKREKQIGRAHV